MISGSVPHSAPEGIEKLIFLLLGSAMLGIEIRFFRGGLLNDLLRKVNTHGNHENEQICCPGGGATGVAKRDQKRRRVEAPRLFPPGHGETVFLAPVGVRRRAPM